jgi:hypothetical protein
MQKGLKGVVLTDELLDHLAEQFDFYSVRDFLGITFEQFLDDPEHHLDRVCKLVGVIIEERRAFEVESARMMKRLWSYCNLGGKHGMPVTFVN